MNRSSIIYAPNIGVNYHKSLDVDEEMLALIVDGASLRQIMTSETMIKQFLILSCLCSCTIFSRMSPS